MGKVYTKAKCNEDMDAVKSAPEADQKTDILLDGIPARVDKIHINGLIRTKDDIIQESVKELFKAQDFQEVFFKAQHVRSKLDSLGCFRNIGVYIDVSKGPKASADGLEVTFNVKEHKRIIGGINTTVGNNEGALVVGAKLPNILGRGEKMQMEYSYGSKKSNNFSLQFLKPIIGKYNSVFTSSLYQALSEWPTSGYKQIDRGFLLDLSFDSFPGLGLRHSIAWDAVIRDLSTLSRATSFAVREQSGLSLKSSLKHSLALDSRDENVFPTEGNILKLSTELAGFGGDVGYLKNELFAQTNARIYKNIIFQAGIQFGILNEINSEKKVTLADQFFLGGPLSLRGFQTRGVGPHSDGNALGSNVFTSAAIHIFTPLPFTSNKGGLSDLFRTHFFVNAGNVASFKSGNINQTILELQNNIRVAYGLGLAARVGNLARIELNYCFPLKYNRGDQLNPGVQFGIGVQFL